MSYHPDAPKRPGSAGLLYGVGGANAIKKILPVARAFVNVLDKEWLYMGDYRIEEVEHLTLAEWRTVPLRVRQKWAAEICTGTWAKLFRVRTVLRRTYDPDYPQKILEETTRDKEQWLNVTPNEISAALDSGIERFHVFTMKPLRYDGELQRKLIRWNEETRMGRAIRF